MPPVRKLPYYTPKTEHIVVSPWQVDRYGDAHPLSNILLEWDPAEDIHAFTTVNINVPAVFEDCGLEDDAILKLGASWASRGTRLSGVGTSIIIHSNEKHTHYPLSVTIAGTLLSHSIEFLVHLLLLTPAKNVQTQFVPTTVGSRLATITHEVALEGIGPRFPVEVINFNFTRYAPDASWALFWDPTNLHQTVDGDIRLYINNRNTTVVRAVTENRPTDSAIREALRYDMAQQIIFGALTNQEFIESSEIFEKGTIGAAIRRMLMVYFHEYTISDVYTMSQRAEVFIPKLQARLKAFWERPL